MYLFVKSFSHTYIRVGPYMYHRPGSHRIMQQWHRLTPKVKSYPAEPLRKYSEYRNASEQQCLVTDCKPQISVMMMFPHYLTPLKSYLWY